MLLPIDRCRDFFDRIALPAPLDEATDMLLGEVRSRLDFLVRVGLGYLTLDRQSRTLSGGEVQRINLTTALGTSLVNTLFVLDEPSIGLHPRDMRRVIEVMHRLRDNGNSLLVVEHDPQIMLTADRLLDIGSGPGRARRPDRLRRHARRTRGARRHAHGAVPLRSPRCGHRGRHVAGHRSPASRASRCAGPPNTTCKHLDVAVPLRRLVCVTGVSGSGKSTLVQDVLYAALLRAKGKPTETPGAHAALARRRARRRDVVMVDQTQIGRTTRSNPASYVGAFDAIRKRFAREAVSIERGYTLGTFSFNSRQRPLPDLRRQRLRTRRDAVPLGRVPALSRLRRQVATGPKSST